MTELKIGYARVSTHGQGLTAQRHALTALGVAGVAEMLGEARQRDAPSVIELSRRG